MFELYLSNTTSRTYVRSSVPIVFIVEHRTRSQPNIEEPWTLQGMVIHDTVELKLVSVASLLFKSLELD